MKKFNLKKYPLLICLIVSAVIIVGSLFVIGFAGLKFDTTIVGGSQVEIVLPNGADAQDYSNSARVVCKHHSLSLYHTAIEDKFVAGETNGEYTTRVLVLTFADKNVSEETQKAYRDELAAKLGFENANQISNFKAVTNMVEGRNMWLVILAIGIIVVCLFVFALIRYDLMAALSLLLAYIHSVMLFFALCGLTRVPLGLTSLASMVVLNIIMSAAIIAIFEDYRKLARLHIESKDTTAQKLMQAQKSSLMPYGIIAAIAMLAALLLLISPSFMVRLAAIAIIYVLIACAYTATLVTPGIYAYLTDMTKARVEAKLSRNETKNKVLKKKVAKNTKKK